jgi:arsenate reductase
MSDAAKVKVLFLCTGNSCRSQMAEGWARHLKPDVIDTCSAGVEPHGVDPRAVLVMAEAGVDISGQRSKDILELMDAPLDYVVTLCGGARETCPTFPGTVQRLHAGFDDPPALAREASSDDEALVVYRRVRDEIRAFVQSLPDGLRDPGDSA